GLPRSSGRKRPRAGGKPPRRRKARRLPHGEQLRLAARGEGPLESPPGDLFDHTQFSWKALLIAVVPHRHERLYGRPGCGLLKPKRPLDPVATAFVAVGVERRWPG